MLQPLKQVWSVLFFAIFMFAKSDFKCCNGSPNSVLFACIERSCEKYALMCGDFACECRGMHRDHRIYQMEDILRVLDETPKLSKEVEERFDAIERLISFLVNELNELRWKHSEQVRSHAGKRPTMDEFTRMCLDKEHANGDFFCNLISQLRGEKSKGNPYQKAVGDLAGHIESVKYGMNLLKNSIQKLWEPCFIFGIASPAVTIKKNFFQAIKTTEDTTGLSSVVLIEPQLSMTAPSKITLRIDNVLDWMTFGVCLRTTFVTKSMKQDLSKLNHGAYMMSTSGLTFSSTRKQYNNVKKANMRLSSGDIVILEYNPTTRILKAQSDAFLETLQTDIDPATTEAVHFCGAFCNLKGQTLSIL